MRRREFIAGLGGAAAWPLTARAQQGDRMRCIGVLIPGDEDDPLAKARISAFAQALAGMGWTEGRNMRMDLRWFDDNTNRIRAANLWSPGRVASTSMSVPSPARKIAGGFVAAPQGSRQNRRHHEMAILGEGPDRNHIDQMRLPFAP
jgi:hypothetical protein